MIHYRYLAQVIPPAPFIYVTLRNPQTGAELHDVPAQVDTGADRTLLTDDLIQALGLHQLGTIQIGGVGGLAQAMPSYLVQVGIHNLPSQLIEVVANADEAWVLLGRDVLNSHRILLDGPRLSLEIG